MQAGPITRWLGLVLLTLALSLGIGEGIARLAGVRVFRVEQTAETTRFVMEDPVLGWRNNPGVHRALEGPGERMTILPDGSRATGTAPGTTGPTVLVIGCSFTEGYGVRDDETFVWKLQQRFPRMHFVNFGSPGYGTYQSLRLLQEILAQGRIRPALVIYGFVGFHVGRNVLTSFNLEAYRAFGGRRFSLPHVELRGGRLEEFPPFIVSDWPLEQHSALMTFLHQLELRFRLRDREKNQIEATLMLVHEMRELIEKEQSRLLVVTLADGGPGPAALQQITGSMARDGIEQLDVIYNGEETRAEKLLVGGNGHPGALMHDWWAARIGQWLAANLGG